MQTEEEDARELRSRMLNTLTQLQLELAAYGWTLSLVPSIHTDPESPPRLKFKHPLCGTEWGLSFHDPVFGLKALAAKDFGECWEREFELSKVAPSTVVHPVLMRNLRGAVMAGGWSPQTLREVLFALLGAGCLTGDEALWVMKAGPEMFLPTISEWNPIELFPEERHV